MMVVAAIHIAMAMGGDRTHLAPLCGSLSPPWTQQGEVRPPHIMMLWFTLKVIAPTVVVFIDIKLIVSLAVKYWSFLFLDHSITRLSPSISGAFLFRLISPIHSLGCLSRSGSTLQARWIPASLCLLRALWPPLNRGHNITGLSCWAEPPSAPPAAKKWQPFLANAEGGCLGARHCSKNHYLRLAITQTTKTFPTSWVRKQTQEDAGIWG